MLYINTLQRTVSISRSTSEDITPKTMTFDQLPTMSGAGVSVTGRGTILTWEITFPRNWAQTCPPPGEYQCTLWGERGTVIEKFVARIGSIDSHTATAEGDYYYDQYYGINNEN